MAVLTANYVQIRHPDENLFPSPLAHVDAALGLTHFVVPVDSVRVYGPNPQPPESNRSLIEFASPPAEVAWESTGTNQVFLQADDDDPRFIFFFASQTGGGILHAWGHQHRSPKHDRSPPDGHIEATSPGSEGSDLRGRRHVRLHLTSTSASDTLQLPVAASRVAVGTSVSVGLPWQGYATLSADGRTVTLTSGLAIPRGLYLHYWH